MATVAHRISEKYRTNDVLISENISFDGLLLSDKVLNGLKNAGFMKPSPIQLKAIPLGRCGLDLIVQAKSGTGKTCVFSVIALESISIDTASTQVLVLAPTREIAVQIWEVIKSIGSAMKGLECHTFIGGLPLNEDRMKLKKCHIAVGSPGRIKQLIETGVLKAENIRMFVLDEADKLLEEGFQDQINWIYSTLPDNKQMLALSATYPEYLADHLTAYMRNPTFLRLNISDPALLGIRQYYQCVTYHPLSHVVFEEKCKVLIHILSSVSFQQCLVFSNIQTRASNLADTLTNKGWPTACIAGCLDQKDRNHAMARLKTYKCRILISTDLTARGIDADKVNLVINMDMPKDHETYLHRIGRAGRFGSFGIAISLVSDGQEQMNMNAIEKRCNTIIHPLPDPLPTDLAKAESPVYLSDMVTSEVINTDNKDGSVLAQSHDLGQNSNKAVDVHVNGTRDTEAPEGISGTTGKLADEEIKDVQSIKGDDCEDIKPVLNRTSTAEVANEKTDTISIYDLCESITNSLNMASKSLTVDSRQDTEVKIDFKHKTCDGSISQEVKEVKHNLQLPITNGISASDTEFEQDKIRLVTNSMDKIQDSLRKENEKAPVIESKKLQSPQKRVVTESGKNSDEHILSGCASIDLSKMFKQTIGYKRKNPGLTYSSAKQTLKEFRETGLNYTEKCDFSLPLYAPNNRDQELLKVAVTQLQDLFDKNIKVKLELLREEIKADKEDFTHDKTEEVTRTADPISQGALSTCTPPLQEVKDWKPDIVDCKHGNESNDLVQKADDRKLSKMVGSLPIEINKEAVQARNKPKKHYTGKFAIAHLLQAGSSLYENNPLNTKETDSQENEETFEKPGKTEHNLLLDKMEIQSDYSDTQKNILPDKCSMGSLANGSTKPKVITRNQNIKAANENSRERISPYEAHEVSSNMIEDLTSDSDSDSTSTSDSVEMSDEHMTQSEYKKPNRSIPSKENTYQWLNQGQWPYLGSVPAHQTSPWVNHYGNQASSQQFQSAYYYPPHTFYDPLWSSHWLYGQFPREKSTEYMNYHMNVTMDRCFNEQKDYIKTMCKNVSGGERSKPKKKEKKKKK